MNRVQAIARDIARVRNDIGHMPSLEQYLRLGNFSELQIKANFKSYIIATKAAGALRAEVARDNHTPRVLIFDIETCPMEALIWSLRQDYIPPANITKQRAIIAWAAKWVGEKKMFYMDLRTSKNVRVDKPIMQPLWNLLNEADIIITKNGKRFDQPVVFGRFASNDLGPPSPFKHDDVEKLFRKHFSLPSYGMDYLAEQFCKKHKKSKHEKFIGMDLWKECMSGNLEAWREMELYNKKDVLVTEELFEFIRPWGGATDINPFHGDNLHRCVCGSMNFKKEGFHRTKAGKFQQYSCRDCGAWTHSKGASNDLSGPAKKASLKTVK